MLKFKFKPSSLLISLLVCSGVTFNAITQTATATAEVVQCSSTDGSERSNPIFFSAVQPTSQGYDLLIVEEQGKYIFTLKPDLTISEGSSIQGQELIPWNLAAYDGSSISLELQSGTFTIEMMVSTRSFCSFRGRAQILNSL